MPMRKPLLVSAISLALVSESTITLAQLNCQHVQGDWLAEADDGNQGLLEIIQQASGNLIGFGQPNGECAEDWPISGTFFFSSGNFSLTLTNPLSIQPGEFVDPVYGCSATVDMSGSVLAPECDRATATATQPPGFTFDIEMSKACDTPLGETQTWLNWGPQSGFPGVQDTMGVWSVRFPPRVPHLSDGGRVGFESELYAIDNCHHFLSPMPYAGLAGWDYTIQTNNTLSSADAIGYSEIAVAYYRFWYPNANCGAQVGQLMTLECTPGTVAVSSGPVGAYISETQVGSFRRGDMRFKSY